MRKATKTYSLDEVNKNWYADGALLRWKRDSPNGIVHRGDVAGCKHGTGYMVVTLGSVQHAVHRIMYMLHHQMQIEPDQYVDHVDRDKCNNSKENLRLCTISQNAMNKGTSKNNTSGYKNIRHVYVQSEKRHIWKVHVRAANQSRQKRFPYTEEGLKAAVEYRDAVTAELHGAFACTGG